MGYPAWCWLFVKIVRIRNWHIDSASHSLCLQQVSVPLKRFRSNSITCEMNLFVSSLTSLRSQKDFVHSKATRLSWNGQSCFVIEAVFFKLPRRKISSNYDFNRIIFQVSGTDARHMLRTLHVVTPLAPCCVWWWRCDHSLRKTLWDPAIVMGVKMIELTRWITISFMMTFTTGHIKLGNFE